MYINSYLSCCTERELEIERDIELSFNNTVIYEPEVITSSFTSNSAVQGGAIFVHEGTLRFDGSY